MNRFSIAWAAMVTFAVACGGSSPATSTISQPASAGSAEPGAGSAAPAPAAAPAECPQNIVDAAGGQRGTCFEPAVLGADVVAACGQLFAGKGWTHDTAAETAIGGQTGKTLICYRAPA